MNINKARQGLEPLKVNSHNEINRNVIQHIATLVHYDCDDADIVARITPTATTPVTNPTATPVNQVRTVGSGASSHTPISPAASAAGKANSEVLSKKRRLMVRLCHQASRPRFSSFSSSFTPTLQVARASISYACTLLLSRSVPAV